MKSLKRIAAGVAAHLLLTSCALLQGVSTTNTASSPAASSGTSTGSAISAIYNVLKATGGIDLSNLTNIINLGKILTGANSLANATSAYTDEFASALISGSSNLVNKQNVSQVMNGLKSLSTIDNSAIINASNTAQTKGFAAGAQPKLSTSDKNVAATMNTLNSLLGALK